MKKMIWLWPLLLSGVMLSAQQKKAKSPVRKNRPAAEKKISQTVQPTLPTPSTSTQVKMFKVAPWISNTDVYEVNVRQYSSEGTFNAFRKELPRLRAMGVSTLWFMPITPIAEKARKELGDELTGDTGKGSRPAGKIQEP